ncbi:uncharacterized protein LOC123265521 isoform X1 [Cotesia glomerata]|uniref:uncharacterized protein LOC123265521 isoform X1 n=2 Tax=Cotesia glomerata TaxID=32391 RepID=UPI001D00E297|nr:uncharacterized protein LOC123265521 isoform X1 [Cotesia glomerata]
MTLLLAFWLLGNSRYCYYFLKSWLSSGNAQVIYHFEESLFNEVKKEHFKSLRVIYDEMSLLHYEAADVHVPWVNIKSKMLRWRRQTRPPVPNSIEQYLNIIEMPEWNFFTSYNAMNTTVTTIEDNDHFKSIIYADLGFLRSLNNVTELIFMDATFKVIPRKPAFRQLFTILGFVQDSVIPLCWVLMKKKIHQLMNQFLRTSP